MFAGAGGEVLFRSGRASAGRWARTRNYVRQRGNSTKALACVGLPTVTGHITGQAPIYLRYPGSRQSAGRYLVDWGTKMIDLGAEALFANGVRSGAWAIAGPLQTTAEYGEGSSTKASTFDSLSTT